MKWFKELMRRRAKRAEDPAARMIFNAVVEQGDVAKAKDIKAHFAYHHRHLLVSSADLKRLLENLAASTRTPKEKAGQLSIFLRFNPFPHADFDADEIAREAIAMNPELKSLIADQDIRAISGPYRTALVREMFEGEFKPYEILRAIPEKVWPQDAWNTEFCKRLVPLALAANELSTAYRAALRLTRPALSDAIWEELLRRGIRAMGTSLVSSEDVDKLAHIATS